MRDPGKDVRGAISGRHHGRLGEESMIHVRSTEPGLALPNDQDASGRSLGEAELARLAEVIESGTLTSTKGTQVPELERRFASMLGAGSAVACSSGSAAIHAAIAAIDPEPGDEIITTSITDMGALAPILYQGAIPVFADVDPTTGNVTADTIADRLSERTVAIVATHLFGNPCDVIAIRALGDANDIPVIEDCAQAFLARRAGRLAGTIGSIGCFSTQQGKHMTTGEGGLVVSDDAGFSRRIRLFVNKAWPYGEENPDHEFLALNSRMTELQGAVANAQLDKLESGIEHRIEMAALLTRDLIGVPGITPATVREDDVATWWKYALLVDEDVIPGGPAAVAAELRLGGIASAPRYIQKPAFACRVFTEQRTFGSSRWPFTLARSDAVDYSPDKFPGTYAFLDSVLVLPWNERYEVQHVEMLGDAIRAAAGHGGTKT
ncbi:MAG: DegT/DnrJ/EryC1/StrS family aminotransferase [Acidimicrobiia bacterium]